MKNNNRNNITGSISQDKFIDDWNKRHHNIGFAKFRMFKIYIVNFIYLHIYNYTAKKITAAMRKWAYGVIYCKYCSHYTKVPIMIDRNSLFCRYCTAKHCFRCILSMHPDIYAALLESHKNCPEYNLHENFESLDFVNRMTTLECGDCLVAIVNCQNNAKDKNWSDKMDPRQVKFDFFDIFNLFDVFQLIQLVYSDSNTTWYWLLFMGS